MFVRLRGLAYLYMVLKTHKSPMKPRFIAARLQNALQAPNKWLHRALFALLPDVHALFATFTQAKEDRLTPSRFAQAPTGCWVVKDSRDVVKRVLNLNDTIRKMQGLRRQVAAGTAPPSAGEWLADKWAQDLGNVAARHAGVRDFSGLYCSLRHEFTIAECSEMIRRVFALHPTRHWLKVHIHDTPGVPAYEWVDQDGHKGPTASSRCFSADEIIDLLESGAARRRVGSSPSIRRW